MSLCSLEGRLGVVVPITRVANLLDQLPTLGHTFLRFGLVSMALVGVHTSRRTIACVMSSGGAVEGVLHVLKRSFLLRVQRLDTRTIVISDSLEISPRSVLSIVCGLLVGMNTVHGLTS